ncbi:MAG: class I SAM-dependent methyltransferase [Bifidobacteriaceae bacterium]|nr:class I SAM-dependent methyltransferase [Bifidobacteriaceae bacterium]
MTFWDLCAPFYDRAERANAVAHEGMLRCVRDLTPRGATVFEAAAGTGAISLAVADKAERVLSTDLSKQMLAVARKKAQRKGLTNITFDQRDIFDTGEPDTTYDVVVAAQVLHLIDKPDQAAAELTRISRGVVIAPVCLLKGLKGLFVRPTVGVWRMLGFAPRREFDADGYLAFLREIGLPPDSFEVIDGAMPLAVPVSRLDR